MNKSLNNRNNSLPQGILRRNRPGIVLLITLILLVVLSTLGYTLSTRVAAQRHRNQYIIDYSIARYGCDSAVKYALATLEDIDPQLISRPNEPDFSDLFYLTEVEYQELLEQWGLESQLTTLDGSKSFKGMVDIGNVDKLGDIGNVNDISSDEIGIAGFDSYDSLTISGPYGPPWPFITGPVEFEVGSAKIRIEIEDENAKYPLGWALLNDKAIQREVQAGFETFCEMTGLNAEQIDSLKNELQKIGEIKPFALDFKPRTRTVKTPITTRTVSSKSRTSKVPQTRLRRKTVSAAEQISEQTTHFAKFFHSSLIDTEALARPTIVSRGRSESALKYMGMWGSMKVNINTAPRHVLEAAFIFGGDEVQIAEEIIQRRRIEPFADIQELKTDLFRYSDSIGKCEKYITTVSRFFTIKVTAVSGVAKASTVIAIMKDGGRVKRIAVING
ncbi:MAG: general secretion pathway protein GspK [Planctomycetes bacterium]|nr:general secretion pathway protein GspK [Planctomycetota bacterium]